MARAMFAIAQTGRPAARESRPVRRACRVFQCDLPHGWAWPQAGQRPTLQQPNMTCSTLNPEVSAPLGVLRLIPLR
jgi:hypothetical protein